MQKNSTGRLAKQMTKHTDLFSNSYISKTIKLSDEHLKLLSKYIGDNLTCVVALSARKFVVSINDDFDFTISLDGYDNSPTKLRHVEYYPFVIQTTSNMYLIVVSKFNIYDVLNREPYRESIGEFRYQAQLAHVLGLINATAYHVLHKQILDEKMVADEDFELMYCGNDSFSFLIYLL